MALLDSEHSALLPHDGVYSLSVYTTSNGKMSFADSTEIEQAAWTR